MTNLQRAALHLVNNGIPARAREITTTGQIDASGVRRPNIKVPGLSSTEAVLAHLAADLWDGEGGFWLGAAVERLDGQQWRIFREALAIARTPAHGYQSGPTCRWCGGPAWPEQHGACRPCADLETRIRVDPELTATMLDAVRRGL